MKCRAAKSQFSAYMEAELSEAARKRVADHLEQCNRCTKELEAVKKTVTLLRWIPQIEAEPSFTEQVMERIRTEETRVSLTDRFRGWWEGLSLELPWRGFELPVPAMASAGGVGLVAGVLMALQLLGIGSAEAPGAGDAGTLASAPELTGLERLSVQPGRSGQVVPTLVAHRPGGAMAGGATAGGTSGRSGTSSMTPGVNQLSHTPAYRQQSPWWQGNGMPAVSGGASQTGTQGAGRQGQFTVQWQETIHRDEFVGPSQVKEVNYIIRRVLILPRQGAREVPDWVRVENDLLTF